MNGYKSFNTLIILPIYIRENLQQIHEQQNRITQSGMYALGGWAVGNLLDFELSRLNLGDVEDVVDECQ